MVVLTILIAWFDIIDIGIEITIIVIIVIIDTFCPNVMTTLTGVPSVSNLLVISLYIVTDSKYVILRWEQAGPPCDADEEEEEEGVYNDDGMTRLSYLVHWEGSAPNCLHEEKSLLPDNDESEEEAEDKGHDGDDVNDENDDNDNDEWWYRHHCYRHRHLALATISWTSLRLRPRGFSQRTACTFAQWYHALASKNQLKSKSICKNKPCRHQA